MKLAARNLQSIRSHLLAASVGAALVSVGVAVLSGIPAQAQTKSKWVVTGELLSPKGKVVYRLEDQELKVVCYNEYLDMSGPLGCVKK